MGSARYEDTLIVSYAISDALIEEKRKHLLASPSVDGAGNNRDQRSENGSLAIEEIPQAPDEIRDHCMGTAIG
uniref:Uncharacterized protein n=1 Tax=Pristionchus pacificus TaxID=54126 RepID=A0A8R1V2K1_PRIPA